jgi:hypothetical protein
VSPLHLTPNTHPLPVMHPASHLPQIATVLITKLCSRGWDVNARSKRLQWTPLHFAVEKGIIGIATHRTATATATTTTTVAMTVYPSHALLFSCVSLARPALNAAQAFQWSRSSLRRGQILTRKPWMEGSPSPPLLLRTAILTTVQYR